MGGPEFAWQVAELPAEHSRWKVRQACDAAAGCEADGPELVAWAANALAEFATDSDWADAEATTPKVTTPWFWQWRGLAIAAIRGSISEEEVARSAVPAIAVAC